MAIFKVMIKDLLAEAKRGGINTAATTWGWDGQFQGFGVATLLRAYSEEYVTLDEFMSLVERELDETCSNGHFSRWTQFGGDVYDVACCCCAAFFNCSGVAVEE